MAANLENLQAVFWEFNFEAAPNKNTIIRYFWDSLQPFFQAQLDVWDKDIDFWNKDVNKTVNTKAKTSFSAPFVTREIDFSYPQD